MNSYRLSVFISVFLCLAVPAAAHAIDGFPGSTWGELRWETPRHGQQNLILEGWVEQGIHWMSWNNIKLNTYAKIRYGWDSEKLDWNNSFGPGVGVALELLKPDGPHIRTGIEYIWERRYESGREIQKAIVFMNWYGWWDLKKKEE
ncbi:MAG: hypothetical protein AB1632_08405 [Nitrospirota bacterium]